MGDFTILKMEQIFDKLLASGMSLIWSVILLLIGIKVINVLRKIMRRALDKSSVDTGVVQFLDAFVKIGSYALLILVLMSRFGIQTASFITILGSAGVAIGLSLQGSLENFAGGLLILLLKPFLVGDYIIACGCEGTVMEISLFATTLHTADNRNVVLPNGTLSNSNIVNISANPVRRVDMSVDVAYGSDLKKAQRAIQEVLEADPQVIKDDPEYPYTIAVDNLGDNGITILVRPWVKKEDYWTVKWRTLEAIYNKLNEEEIEIPFPQMTVHMD